MSKRPISDPVNPEDVSPTTSQIACSELSSKLDNAGISALCYHGFGMYFFILIIILIVTYVLFGIVQSSSPKGFAKGLAKAQLISLNAFKNKNPGAKDATKQYQSALSTRPGYTEEMVDNIIKDARGACKESGIKFNFQAVVIQLAAYEYMKRTGNSPLGVMNDLSLGVTSTIPENL